MQTMEAAAATASGIIRSPLALRDMLARISLEIDGAAGIVGDFQDVLSRAIGLQDDLPSEQLQSLDLLYQILGDLGSVVAALGSMHSVGDQVDTADALDRCKLSDLATRLGGGKNLPASHEIELF